MKRSFKAVRFLMVAIFALILAGCGGGGEGGTPSAPTDNGISLSARTMKYGDTGWGGSTINVITNQTFAVQGKMQNKTGSANIPYVAVVMVPATATTFVPGTAELLYGETNSKKDLSDAIASTTGISTGISFDNDDWMYFSLNAKSPVTAGTYKVILRAAKDATGLVTAGGFNEATVTVNVTAGPVTTGTIVVTSNKATTVTVGSNQYQVATDGGNYTINNAAPATYGFLCGVIVGYTVSANYATVTLEAGQTINLSCTYTPANNASCSYNGQTYAHGTTVQQGSCTSCTCNNSAWGNCTGACPSVGTIQVSSNKATSVTINGVSFSISAGTTTITGQDPGLKNFACGSIVNTTWTSLPASATLTAGGNVAFSCAYTDIVCTPPVTPTCGPGQKLQIGNDVSTGCETRTCVPDPTAQTGTVIAQTNVVRGLSGVAVSCGGSTPTTLPMNDLGNGYWGYSMTANSGSCTLSNYPSVVSVDPLNLTKLDPLTGRPYTLLSGPLTGNGTVTLTLYYGGLTGPDM